MTSTSLTETQRFRAFVLPFAVFMVFLLVLQCVEPWVKWEHPSASWWQRAPEQWLYPVQSIVCAVLLGLGWRFYEWGLSCRALLWGAAMGIVGIGAWLLPLSLHEYFVHAGREIPSWMAHLGVVERGEGFNPSLVFSPQSAAWWWAMMGRFFRAVVVVAFVEEIFWRGFLMRWAINRDYPWRVPFGQGSWGAYGASTVGFVLIHAPADYLGAWCYGSLTYFVAVKTKSLGACVLMHAVANAILGAVAVGGGYYGLW